MDTARLTRRIIVWVIFIVPKEASVFLVLHLNNLSCYCIVRSVLPGLSLFGKLLRDIASSFHFTVSYHYYHCFIIDIVVAVVFVVFFVFLF